MEWIAKKLECKDSDLEELFSDRFSLSFLMTWVLFEKRCFNGYIRQADIITFDSSRVILNSKMKLHFEYFHDRYQDVTKYRQLVHGKNVSFIDGLISSEKDNISDKDALRFLIYVVYRYRNNMFHGNKGLQSWICYKDQIEHCIEVMKYVCDSILTEEENTTS